MKKELKGLEGNRILIPDSIITNIKLSKYRVATLAYIYTMTGLTYRVNFSVKLIVSWLGRCNDRHMSDNGNNAASGVKGCIEYFKKTGILSYEDEKLKFATLVDGYFDKEKYSQSYSGERFSKIYIDELNTIIDQLRQ